MEEYEDVSEDLICPICLHLPIDVIYQCHNGHSICGECCNSINKCPQCRVSYNEGKIRNRSMESFIGSMKSACPYKSSGCSQVLQRKDLSSHKQVCTYNPEQIPKIDPWILTPAERTRFMEQFKGLNPVEGVITGNQAKGLLLQSGLPSRVLGQIWSLADVNYDGKMDISEFSVACKLITMKLRGSEIPPVLPSALKAVLASCYCDRIASPLMDWAVPNASRLKYTQIFNQHDKTESGYLTGVQARNILLGTGLPKPILARVWDLSDMDSDGRLGLEEFVLALHLCDLFKQTDRLPPKLTPELIPPSFRTGPRKQSN